MVEISLIAFALLILAVLAVSFASRIEAKKIEATYSEYNYPLYKNVIDLAGTIMKKRRFVSDFSTDPKLLLPIADSKSFSLMLPATFLYRHDYFALAWISWQLAWFEYAQNNPGRGKWLRFIKQTNKITLLGIGALLVAIALGQLLVGVIALLMVLLIALVLANAYRSATDKIAELAVTTVRETSPASAEEIAEFRVVWQSFQSEGVRNITGVIFWLIHFLNPRSLVSSNQ